MKHRPVFRRIFLSATIAALLGVGVAQAAVQSHSSFRWFSMDNLIGDFDGTMLGPMGNGTDDTIVCGAAAIYPGSPACTDPDGVLVPVPGDEATTLYPIDSAFGFEVVPFALAVQKERDGVYAEGWVGNIMDGTDVRGIEFSDAATDTFLVPAGLGTWCTGLGGESVKCSTEQYTVMEHVLTCHETVPYLYADEDTGEQMKIYDPEDPMNLLVDCADTQLDNNLRVINSDTEVPDLELSLDGMMVGTAAYDPETAEIISAIDWVAIADDADPDNPLTFLEPNESTVLDDIAYGNDYLMTAKDDGKPLYRWGNLIKRPNDIRVFTRMWLPQDWFGTAARSVNNNKGYRVIKAHLIVNHRITNNPNDQIRPEDMENEAAIGRLPGYTVNGNKWESDKDCYQGNGIEIPMGTLLKNGDFAIPATDVTTHVWDNNPYAWSNDLRNGMTNGWFTTVDREPFEWSYDSDTDMDGISDSFREPQDPEPGDLLSGPRWRLTPNKFGQNLPGLEVPKDNCAPPPYQKDMIKYAVGDQVQTKINLLDWKSTDERSIDGESPLNWTNGWTTNGWFNDGTVVNPDVTIVNPAIKRVTVNGSPVTRGFDLTLYIKGDKKPTSVYSARLLVDWDDNPNWVAP